MKLCYGSLYMDALESAEYAETQIVETVRLALADAGNRLDDIGLGFDIVATPEQVQSGRPAQMARHILTYVDKTYPRLRVRVVGVTDDDKRRPIRDMILLRVLGQQPTLSMRDIDDVHIFTYE